ncbi:M23 family metallopeptidase [Paenibacillus dakarensis]|uniref:M23 family metallopeptidase n=1 Tax=Paenibacillus dakarensis TaxID=1527293 RepID=UPI0006D583A3|nr:M23 family metallopeptidase [Paenibacillus dakarensis]
MIISIQRWDWQTIKARWAPAVLITAAVAAAALMAPSYAAAADKEAVLTETGEVKAQPQIKTTDVFSSRRILYDRVSALTQIPWYRLAAIDQYERTLTSVHPKDRKHPERLTGIFVQPAVWSGPLNPNLEDTHPSSISLFNGMGQDGDGDGIADPNNDMDLLYSISSKLKPHGHSMDDFAIGLWAYYQNGRSVQRIMQYSKLYEKFGKLDLFKHSFPLPIGNNYSYRSTFGMGRNWGGYRIHEGTDLFAGYGVPVRSTCYGIIELKGWNKYGGWRIGIRDLNNYYHYYAHLQGFDKNIKAGDIVVPGQSIGWVGSSGYGKPGTQGKFPPHLHYGIYRDTGLTEWSFDPYPLLKHWENQERQSLRKSKKARP